MRFLTDVRDPGAEAAFVKVVQSHTEVERYHDLRSIIIDDQFTLLVAEIELREEAIVATLQSRIDDYEQEYLAMLSDSHRADPKIGQYCRTRAAAQATLERTEIIIEELAAAVRAAVPRIHHVTIEVEGIATAPPTGNAGSEPA